MVGKSLSFGDFGQFMGVKWRASNLVKKNNQEYTVQMFNEDFPQFFKKIDVEPDIRISVVDGTDGYSVVTTPFVGQKLYANIILKSGDIIGVYPKNELATYEWRYYDTDTVIGTEPVYTVTSDNIGKFIKCIVTYPLYEFEEPVSMQWVAKSGVVEQKPEELMKISVVDGTDGYSIVTIPFIGQVLLANVILSSGEVIGGYPVNADMNYKWFYTGTDNILGTEAYYTVTKDNLNKVISCEVEYFESTAVWNGKAVVEKKTIENKPLDGYESFIPLSVLEMFIGMANEAIQEQRWFEKWRYAMGLYLAHYITLYMKSYSNGELADTQSVVSAGGVSGVLSGARLGDSEVTYDTAAVTAATSEWGAWNMTTYGQILVTEARLVGMGGSYLI